MSCQYIDLAYLDAIAGNDQSLRKTLLDMVQKELATAVPEMEKACKQQDWDTLHGIAHKLKTTLAFVGNAELTEANRQLLSNLEAKNYQADFVNYLSTYHQLYDPIAKELQLESDKYPSSSN